MSRLDLRLGLAIDRWFTQDIETVCKHIARSATMEFESMEEMKYGLMQALLEYWLFAEWAGIEFFVEVARDVKAVSNIQPLVLIRRLADCPAVYYPRTNNTANTLKDEVDRLGVSFYIKEHTVDERLGTIVVCVGYDVF